MKNTLLKITTLFYFITFSFGCVTIPQQSFDKSENSDPIKTIAMVEIQDPKEISVFNLGGVGMLFGIFGAAAQIEDAKKKTEIFSGRMQDLELDIGNNLTTHLKTNLAQSGYEVSILEGNKPTIKENNFDYQDINTDADAILHVWFNSVGYLSPPDSLDYKPRVIVHSALISAKDKSQKYYQIFAYGPSFGTREEIVHLNNDEQFEYGSFDTLIENASQARIGLLQSVPKISSSLANQL